MYRRVAAVAVLTLALGGTAVAGHHYYYGYPAYGYVAPVYAGPVYVPPVVVSTPAYYVPAPVYYRPARVWHAPVRYSYFHGYHPYRGDVEVKWKWKRGGYRFEIDYDD